MEHFSESPKAEATPENKESSNRLLQSVSGDDHKSQPAISMGELANATAQGAEEPCHYPRFCPPVAPQRSAFNIANDIFEGHWDDLKLDTAAALNGSHDQTAVRLVNDVNSQLHNRLRSNATLIDKKDYAGPTPGTHRADLEVDLQSHYGPEKVFYHADWRSR